MMSRLGKHIILVSTEKLPRSNPTKKKKQISAIVAVS